MLPVSLVFRRSTDTPAPTTLSRLRPKGQAGNAAADASGRSKDAVASRADLASQKHLARLCKARADAAKEVTSPRPKAAVTKPRLSVAAASQQKKNKPATTKPTSAAPAARNVARAEPKAADEKPSSKMATKKTEQQEKKPPLRSCLPKPRDPTAPPKPKKKVSIKLTPTIHEIPSRRELLASRTAAPGAASLAIDISDSADWNLEVRRSRPRPALDYDGDIAMADADSCSPTGQEKQQQWECPRLPDGSCDLLAVDVLGDIRQQFSKTEAEDVKHDDDDDDEDAEQLRIEEADRRRLVQEEEARLLARTRTTQLRRLTPSEKAAAPAAAPIAETTTAEAPVSTVVPGHGARAVSMYAVFVRSSVQEVAGFPILVRLLVYFALFFWPFALIR